jgi:hypothetical protein
MNAGSSSDPILTGERVFFVTCLAITIPDLRLSRPDNPSLRSIFIDRLGAHPVVAVLPIVTFLRAFPPRSKDFHAVRQQRNIRTL